MNTTIAVVLGSVACVLASSCNSEGLRKTWPDASGTGGATTGSGGATGTVQGSGGAPGSGGRTSSGTGGSPASGTGGLSMPSSGSGGSPGTGGISSSAVGGVDGTDAGIAGQGGAGGAGGAVIDPTRDGGAVPDAPMASDAWNGPATGTGGVGGLDGGFGEVGGALGAFCVGGESKVAYKGQTYTVPVTSKWTDPWMSCCFAYAATLHTRDLIGANVEAVLQLQVGGDLSGPLSVGEGRVFGSLRSPLGASDAGTAGDPALIGSAWFRGKVLDAQPWTMGLCLAVSDSASPWQGTQIYVPGVTGAPSEWASRFRLWLLKDAALTGKDVDQVDIKTLELASEPLIDLMDIDFVEQESKHCPSGSGMAACTWLGLNTAFLRGSTLKSTIGPTTVSGKPFIVEADGERIYLGSFASAMSSFAIHGPEAMIEDIADDGFAIYPPFINAPPIPPDPRSDPRIVKVLSESGKLVP